MIKNILKSKIVWYNLVMTIVELTAFLKEMLPAEYLPYAIAIHGFGNIILRIWFTKTDLTIPPESDIVK